MARTVGEVAALAGVSVRTLHHYDEIGLVQPSGRSQAGYRLYGERDLERLQTVLFYRELGFSLERIAAILRDPGFDRGVDLLEQRALLEREAKRIAAMIDAVDAAIDAHERGITMSDQSLFAVFGDEHRGYLEEAEQRWGHTAAWRQSSSRTRRYRKEDWRRIKQEGEAIMQRQVEVFRSGAAPGSSDAMDAVEAHRQHITTWFYDCSPQAHEGLGELYVSDPRFTAYYDDHEPELAAFVRDAIAANAERVADRS